MIHKDFPNLENWEKAQQMKFNQDKCYVIHVSKKTKPLKYNYLLHKHKHIHVLQQVENSNYLGVTISNYLDLGPHINNIATKSNKILGFLRRNVKNCTRRIKNFT